MGRIVRSPGTRRRAQRARGECRGRKAGPPHNEAVTELPAEYELISLFESEPHLLDPELPWVYNTITFELTRGHDEVTVIIDPGMERVHIRWSRSGEEVLDVMAEGVARISAEEEPNRETLVLHFHEDLHRDDLRLRVKPEIHLYWRTRGHIP